MDEARGSRRLGFVGLGDMGGAIALNLVRNDAFDVVVYDRRPEAATEHVEEGARAVSSLAEVAEHAEIIGVCVLYDDQLRDVVGGPDGLLAHGRPGQIVIVHSTVLPETVADLAARAREKGMDVLDAPVTKPSRNALEGTLTLIVGGEEDVVARCRPVLDSLGDRIVRVGVAGQGQAAKLGNQIMGMGTRLLVLEALRFAKAHGLEEQVVLDIINVSSGACWAAANQWHTDLYGFEHTLAGTDELPHRMAKDLRYAIESAQANRRYLPITAVAAELTPSMMRERWAEVERRGVDEDARRERFTGGLRNG